MKKWWILLTGVFVIGWIGNASAHVGGTFYLNEITAATPITIDAVLDDWSWADPSTIITSDDLEDVLGGEMQSKDDWDCVVYGGWSQIDNMLYFGVKIMDDMWNNDTPDWNNSWKDDNVHIIVDANHDGGNYRETDPHCVTAQQYGFHIPGPANTPVFFMYAPEEMQWSTQSPWVKWAYDGSNVPDVAIYEWKMAIWDRVDPAGPGASERHICTANETIGLTLQFDDVDAEPDVRDCQPGTGGPESGRSWTDASALSDFVLLQMIFPDPNLTAGVREALNKPGGPISDADLAGLTELNAPQRGISDLTGIERCVNLRKLWVEWNQISDLGPVSGLTNLQDVMFNDNQISDISPLSGLTNLQILNLNSNQKITDLSPLSGLTNLSILELNANQISDLSPLSGLTNLQCLRLESNQISDLSPLSGLTKLREIFLHTNQISDLSPLSGLTSLSYLDLWGNQISDLSPLSNLTNLQGVGLSHNQISDIQPLVDNSGMGSGDEVDLKDNPLNNEAHIIGIPALQARGVNVLFDAKVIHVPDIALSEASYNFGDVEVGSASVWVLRVSNEGDLDLTVSEISSSDAQFSVSIASFTVAPGEAKEVTVTFTPSSVGSKAGSLTAMSDDLDEGTLQISLSGNATDTTPPEIVLPSPVVSSAEGDAIPISASITDNTTIQSATLHYRQGGASSFVTVSMSKGEGDAFQGGIPAEAVTHRGVEYYVSVEDAEGNGSTSPISDPAEKPHSIQVIFSDIASPDPLPFEVWRMISVPVLSDEGDPGKVLSELGAYDNTQWRLFSHDADGYHEYKEEQIGGFEPGKAFWLHTLKEGAKAHTGSGKTVSMDESFRIVLQPGWNDIAVPFYFPVRWEDVMAESGNPSDVVGLYYYDGLKWLLPGSKEQMEPWEGYAAKNRSDAVVSLLIPPRSANVAGKPLAKHALEDNERITLQIKASVGRVRDESNFIGWDKQAKIEWDALDYPEPPKAPGHFLSLYFPHRDWEVYPDQYTSDFRPERHEGETWDFIVETDLMHSEAALYFEGLSKLPSGLKAYLMNEEAGTFSELKEGIPYPFSTGNGSRGFRLVLGDKGALEESTSALRAAPSSYALFPNHPNPFNAETRIAYQVAEVGNVRITVWNLLGQEVVTLVDEGKDPGYFSLRWDGRDGDGSVLGSGIYLCAMESKGIRLVRKMLIVR